MRVSVDVKGARAAARKIRELEDADARASRETLREQGEQMAEAMRNLVPVDTGYLRSLIEARVTKSGKTVRVGAFDQRGNKRWYAHFVEFGTHDTPEQPFVQPGFETEVSGLVPSLRRNLLEEVEDL